jgi:hypothetical protein
VLTGLRGAIDCISNTVIAATGVHFIGNNVFLASGDSQVASLDTRPCVFTSTLIHGESQCGVLSATICQLAVIPG